MLPGYALQAPEQSNPSAPSGTTQHCALLPLLAQAALNSSVVVTGPAMNMLVFSELYPRSLHTVLAVQIRDT